MRKIQSKHIVNLIFFQFSFKIQIFLYVGSCFVFLYIIFFLIIFVPLHFASVFWECYSSLPSILPYYWFDFSAEWVLFYPKTSFLSSSVSINYYYASVHLQAFLIPPSFCFLSLLSLYRGKIFIVIWIMSLLKFDPASKQLCFRSICFFWFS